MKSVEAVYRHHCSQWSDIRAHLPYVAKRARGDVLELGTRGGVSTSALLWGVEQHGGHVWSVDTSPECAVLYDGHEQWTFVHADSCDVAAIEAVGAPYAWDVILFDTLHTYEQVYRELTIWGDKLKPGGVILVHDTDTFEGARRAVAEWAAGKGYDVHWRSESNGMAVVNIPPGPVRVAAILPAYNTPELVDRLVESVGPTAVDLDWIVVEDGGDRPSRYTTVYLRHQLRPNRARLVGLHYADMLAATYGAPYFAYWMMATSAQFAHDNPRDVLTELVRFLQETPGAVCVQPAYTPGSIAPWAGLLGDRGTGKPRRVWSIEYVAALYRADWFDSAGRLPIEHALGWGTDMELAYLARQQGRSLWVHEGLHVKKDSVVAHEMGRRRRSAQEYWQDAGREMERVFSQRYGADWRTVLESGVDEAWR